MCCAEADLADLLKGEAFTYGSEFSVNLSQKPSALLNNRDSQNAYYKPIISLWFVFFKRRWLPHCLPRNRRQLPSLRRNFRSMLDPRLGAVLDAVLQNGPDYYGFSSRSKAQTFWWAHQPYIVLFPHEKRAGD